MISTKTMHRKPTYNELIYDMENTKLRDFKIDRDATILRRRPELTRFDENFIFDSNNMHEIKQNMARSAFQQIYQTITGATGPAAAVATVATEPAAVVETGDTELPTIPEAAVSSGAAAASVVSGALAAAASAEETSDTAISSAATAAMVEHETSSSTQQQSILSALGVGLGSSSSHAQDIATASPTQTYDISDPDETRKAKAAKIMTTIKSNSLQPYNLTDERIAVYKNKLKITSGENYEMIIKYAKIEQLYQLHHISINTYLDETEKSKYVMNILDEIEKEKIVVETEQAASGSVETEQAASGSVETEISLEIEPPVDAEITKIRDKYYVEKIFNETELETIKNMTLPLASNTSTHVILQKFFNLLSLPNDIFPGIEKTKLQDNINNLKKYLTVNATTNRLTKKSNMSTKQGKQFAEIKKDCYDIIENIKKNIP